MAVGTSLTIQISPETSDNLGRLASDVRRSRTELAAEAVERYVEQQLRVVDGIRRGIADMESGRVVPHDEAMAELDAVIEAALRKRGA